MSSQQTKSSKGILKKTNVPTLASADNSKDETKRDAREIAVQHARIIHSRSAIQDQIQDSIIELAKFPPTRGLSYGASDPAPADAESFKQLVRLYQPSDYDDLIEERNCNGLCGYALCPKPRIRVSQGGKFKLVNYGKKDFNIVPTEELERWCSQKCAKRAMYVKVQLNESAAWERAGIPSIQIDLLEEQEQPRDDARTRLVKELDNLKIEVERKAMRDSKELALERGDCKEEASKRSVDVNIREKTVKLMPVESPSASEGQGHLLLDGYKTKFDQKSSLIFREDSFGEEDSRRKSKS